MRVCVCMRCKYEPFAILLRLVTSLGMHTHTAVPCAPRASKHTGAHVVYLRYEHMGISVSMTVDFFGFLVYALACLLARDFVFFGT